MIDQCSITTDRTQLSEKQWKSILEEDTANFFQTPQALLFFEKTGIKTFSFIALAGEDVLGIVSGIILKKKGIQASLTSRAIIYGGPVFSKKATKQDISGLLTAVIEGLKNKVIYIEIRNFTDYSNYRNLYEEVGFSYQPHLNFQVACDDYALMKKRMSSSKLRQIKKSIKAGASIQTATTEAEIKAYYTLLYHLYKTKVKTPLPTYQFFKKLWETNTAVFLLIAYKDEIIGGIVCPVFSDKVIYEWFICGMDRVYKDVYPSVLATWAAMEYAHRHHIACFDFMGAGKPEEAYGVREFKSKFGGVEVEYGRFLCVSKPILYEIGKTAVKVLKRKK
ncbi:lipid II:glycine glycyltransferase FemX [Aquimarina hainanensis]|uniref:Lipid II:glycine glycyltransferase FemX n=1 Tax=Aquimarina hainanensis TaxID=1578017 RepID=A0ABW5N7J0_9FLAO